MDATALPFDQTVVVTDDNHIRLKVTRTSGDTVRLEYEDPETGASVLQGRVSISNEMSELDFFDPEFWTLVVQGEERSPDALDDLPNEPMSFRVVEEERRLLIERKRFAE